MRVLKLLWRLKIRMNAVKGAVKVRFPLAIGLEPKPPVRVTSSVIQSGMSHVGFDAQELSEFARYCAEQTKTLSNTQQ
jgi:hypothetical protein